MLGGAPAMFRWSESTVSQQSSGAAAANANNDDPSAAATGVVRRVDDDIDDGIMEVDGVDDDAAAAFALAPSASTAGHSRRDETTAASPAAARRAHTTSSIDEAQTAHEQATEEEEEGDARFKCSICLCPVNSEPVVTSCGHLYCWPCLYRWLEPGVTVEEYRLVFLDAGPIAPYGSASRGSSPAMSGGQQHRHQRAHYSAAAAAYDGADGWSYIRSVGVSLDHGFHANTYSRRRAVNDSRRKCPVCKASCNVTTVIPLYVDDVAQGDGESGEVENGVEAGVVERSEQDGDGEEEGKLPSAAVGGSGGERSVEEVSSEANGAADAATASAAAAGAGAAAASTAHAAGDDDDGEPPAFPILNDEPSTKGGTGDDEEDDDAEEDGGSYDGNLLAPPPPVGLRRRHRSGGDRIRPRSAATPQASALAMQNENDLDEDSATLSSLSRSFEESTNHESNGDASSRKVGGPSTAATASDTDREMMDQQSRRRGVEGDLGGRASSTTASGAAEPAATAVPSRPTPRIPLANSPPSSQRHPQDNMNSRQRVPSYEYGNGGGGGAAAAGGGGVTLRPRSLSHGLVTALLGIHSTPLPFAEESGGGGGDAPTAAIPTLHRRRGRRRGEEDQGNSGSGGDGNSGALVPHRGRGGAAPGANGFVGREGQYAADYDYEQRRRRDDMDANWRIGGAGGVMGGVVPEPVSAATDFLSRLLFVLACFVVLCLLLV